MNVILTEGASCQGKGCFVLRILPDSVTSASDRCAYVRKADTWSMERLLSQRMGPQGEQNAGSFSVQINDYQWICGDTIVAKLTVALAPMPFEDLLDHFVAATSGVFPDNQKREDRVFDTKAEVGKDSTSSFWKMDKDHGVRLNRWPVLLPCWCHPNSQCQHYIDDWNDVSKDELDSEVPPGEETRYEYIMGMIDTCSL